MTAEQLVVHINAIELAPELSRTDAESAVRAAADAERVAAGEISITFCSTDEITRLNREYLGRTAATDVIAFNLENSERPLADIYICPEVARRNAEELDVRGGEELLRLVVHGALHVLGYDHPEGVDREASEMFRKQEAILSKLNPPGYS